VQLLESERSTPESHAFARKIIARQTKQLGRLIDDLLDVGRVITGKIHLQKEALDLAEAAENAINTIRAAGHAANHRLSFDGEPVRVIADRARIEQVVVNLVSNALACTPPEGTVEVSVTPDGDDAVLTVQDEGIGLEAHDLERVFDLFFQAQGGLHRKGGLGIGLTLVRRIVELHGGTVAGHSEGAGKGARFTVRLPAVTASALDIKVEAATSRGPRALSILVIEDNDDARESLAQILGLEGHTVHVACDGRSGVEMAQRLAPDVAIIDIGLPEIDGYEVARRLRADRKHATLLVALTGYGQPEDERRAHEAGFDAHLVKPAEFGKLRALLEVAARAAA